MRFLIFLLAFPIFLSGCEITPGKKSAVLVRFGTDQVTEAEFKQKLDSLPREMRLVAGRNKKQFAEDIVSEHFLYQEAKKRGLDKLPDVKELLKAANRKIIVAKLIEIEVDKKVKVEPDEAEKYYDLHKEEFMTPMLLKASHILVEAQVQAQAIKDQLDQGADFEELARRHSLDGSAIKGGDLGFFQKGRFVPEFEEAVTHLTKGQISPVVKTQFGYHLIKLTDRLDPTIRDFRMIKNSLEEKIISEKRYRLFKELMKRLEGNTKILIDDKELEKVRV